MTWESWKQGCWKQTQPLEKKFDLSKIPLFLHNFLYLLTPQNDRRFKGSYGS